MSNGGVQRCFTRFDTTRGVRRGMFVRMPGGWLWVPDWVRLLCPEEIPCGSGPARDGGVSAAMVVGFDGLIASRLAPTGDLQ
ncbi:hypothetical protein D3C73_1454760 [compost metagenome]